MASDTLSRISEVTSEWVNRRDRMTRQHAILNISQGEFFDELNNVAEQLATILPGLTVEQWRALHELTGSHTAEMEMRIQAFRKQLG